MILTFFFLLGFQPRHFQSLHDAPFILVRESEKKLFMKPSECYIGSADGAIHAKLFTFVDPQSASAQSFLVACGVPEPSPQQVIDTLLPFHNHSSPRRGESALVAIPLAFSNQET